MKKSHAAPVDVVHSLTRVLHARPDTGFGTVVPTCELEHAVEAAGVVRRADCRAGGSLEVSGHLVLDLERAHAAASLQVVEIDELIRLSHQCRIL